MAACSEARGSSNRMPELAWDDRAFEYCKLKLTLDYSLDSHVCNMQIEHASSYCFAALLLS